MSYTVTFQICHMAALFGPEYVALFGKEKLLTTPAYKVEELGDDLVFVQLTEKMNDIRDKYDMVMAKREEAKRHLGYDCFYQKELLYHWDKNINNKSKPPYRAPSFTLIDYENAVRKKAELLASYKANREEDRKRTEMI